MQPPASNPIKRWVQGVPAGAPIPRQYQHAILRLYQSMGRAGLVAEDLHLENVYFVRKGIRLEAGILDLERITTFNGNIADGGPRMRSVLTSGGRGGENIHSMLGAPRTPRVGYGHHRNKPVWLGGQLYRRRVRHAKMLEHKQYIRFDPEAQTWHSRLLELDVVEQYFPRFREHLGHRIPEISINGVPR